MRLLFAAGLLGLLAVLAAASGCGPSGAPAGPSVLEAGAAKFHDKAPNDARPALPRHYTDADGRPVDLDAFRGKSSVVLVVMRGYVERFKGFCPGCVAQVHALVANYDEFKGRGAEVLVLFPGAPGTLGAYLEQGKADGAGGNPKLPFPILLDPELAAVRALGIESELAKQSTFVIDRDGKVVFGYVGDSKDSYDRPSVKAVLAQLDKLNGKR